MEGFLIDFAIIFCLVVFNGFFSGSEIALLSVKKGRLDALAGEGNQRARLLRNLKSDPDRLFATVQIGVTLLGTLAAVYGGDRLLEHVRPWLATLENSFFTRERLELGALGVLVLMMTYLSLVFGELIPKSLAHKKAEAFALFIAWPLHIFSKAFALFTQILTFSSNLFLRLFKDHTSFAESRILEEEVLGILEEGVKSGSIARHEHEMMESVFALNDRTAREIMTPRVHFQALEINADLTGSPDLLKVAHSRIPVYERTIDHIVGFLHVQDWLRAVAAGTTPELRGLLRPAVFIPEGMKVNAVLREMQHKRTHIAVVADEYGGTAGLVSIEDVLEEIVGELMEQHEDETEGFKEIAPGIILAPGDLSVAAFNRHSPDHPIDESPQYSTLAGFAAATLGRLPEAGESFSVPGLRFELLKRIGQRLVQFRITVSFTATKSQNV